MALTITLIALFFICFAMLWNEGMWGNALTLINAILAAVIASNFFEPAADFMDKQAGSYTYLWDYLMLWGLFALSFLVLRAVTDAISPYRIKYKLPVEQAGRAFFALATGWLLVCFFLMALHTAPLAQTAFKGSFGTSPMANYFLGTAPDRIWLGYMQSLSRGILSQGTPQVFDSDATFIPKYGSRRDNFSKEPEVRVSR
jgi:hypothetical protein